MTTSTSETGTSIPPLAVTLVAKTAMSSSQPKRGLAWSSSKTPVQLNMAEIELSQCLNQAW